MSQTPLLQSQDENLGDVKFKPPSNNLESFIPKESTPDELVQRALSNLTVEGPNASFFYETARQCVEKALDKTNNKHAQANNTFGVMYCHGRGVEKNLEKAFNYFKRGAADDDADALFNLGNLHQDKGDFEEAVKCFIASAKKGIVHAAHKLGDICITGYEINSDDPDIKKKGAYDWYLEAANAGNADSQFNVAVLHYHQSTKEDEIAAVYWWGLAAKQGHATAQLNLAVMFVEGKGGLEPDPREAYKLYLKSANQGNITARISLAKGFEHGFIDGGIEDIETAIGWYFRAYEQGRQEISRGIMTNSELTSSAEFALINYFYSIYRAVGGTFLHTDNNGVAEHVPENETPNVAAQTPELLRDDDTRNSKSTLLIAVFERADEIARLSKGGRPAEKSEHVSKIPTQVRIDADVINWLKSKGPHHNARLGGMLRALMEADAETNELP